MKTFGEMLTLLRESRRISKAELGRRAHNLDDTYISRLERGIRDVPPIETVDVLAQALGLSDAEWDELRLSGNYRPYSMESADATVQLVALTIANPRLSWAQQRDLRELIQKLCEVYSR